MMASLKAAHLAVPSTKAVEVKNVGVDALKAAKHI
jgi:hypothetical protein